MIAVLPMSRCLLVAGALLLSLLAGCMMASDQVKPTELPKLNAPAIAHGGRGGDNDVYLAKEAHLEAPDGRLLEISGEAGVGIESNGRTMVFDYPVKSEVVGDTLVIHSSNHPETRFSLDEIDAAYARTPSGWNSVVGLLGGAALGSGMFLIWVAVCCPS